MKWIILGVIISLLLVRVLIRGYFWKDRKGKRLSFKQFMKRWKTGVEGTTPLQQTTISLWGFPFIFGGIFTGLVIMFFRREYWLILILAGSLPITSMQFLSLWQKYKRQKLIDKQMRELNA
jgi:hypothetical protein